MTPHAPDNTVRPRPYGGASAGPIDCILMELELRAFRREHAPIVASWVQTERDLLWLAPGTRPPLTPRKILAWRSELNSPQVLFAKPDRSPCGYGELNRMRSDPTRYWLGHVIVAPSHRGQGVGQRLVEMLLVQAFNVRKGKSVSLVVFPENQAATACYGRCGFTVTREEHHQFRRTGGRHRMLRMDLDRRHWLERFNDSAN